MNQRIDELRSLLQEDPGSRRFFLLGDLLRKTGEFNEAQDVLTAGLEHHPRYVAAWVSLGRIQLDRDQFSDAERSFARALELDPENAVAARLIGETAEKGGEWVRAIKAYKLARALTPGDIELETKIEKIECLLAGDADEVSSVAESAPEILEEPAVLADPFEIEVEAPDSDPFGSVVEAPRSREVISISDDDPFAVIPTGDTGVWMVADDVFAQPEYSDEVAGDDVFGESLETATPEEVAPVEELSPEELSPEELPNQEVPVEVLSEPVAALEPEMEPEAEPEAAQESDYSRDISLPTVTLARLALEQDDRSLAEETLKAVLERDPGNMEAAQLLGVLDDEVAPESAETPAQMSPVSPAELLALKASKLKGWMEDIRTATERRAP